MSANVPIEEKSRYESETAVQEFRIFEDDLQTIDEEFFSSPRGSGVSPYGSASSPRGSEPN